MVAFFYSGKKVNPALLRFEKGAFVPRPLKSGKSESKKLGLTLFFLGPRHVHELAVARGELVEVFSGQETQAKPNFFLLELVDFE